MIGRSPIPRRERRIALEPGAYERCIGSLVAPPRDPRLAGIPLPVQWGPPQPSIDKRRRLVTG